ncbi:MAG: hypothetical protein JKY88_02170 [Pseudomonadales bacterium]|nr:hypothetical protein [Pseudomonadales bacterium]
MSTRDQIRNIRSTALLAPPITLAPAFRDLPELSTLLKKGSPYKTLSAVHKNIGETSAGWFRNFWALGGKVVFDGAEDYFYNPLFIDAAKRSFQAEIIRPVAMMTNLNLPAKGSPKHLDLPFFRGLQNREVPSWMLASMGYSQLFHEWAIPVASAITWFYPGPGGDFEYWPDGIDQASKLETAPFLNRAVLADNEYMYHRVGALGPGSKQLAYEDIGYSATLRLSDEKQWLVEENDNVLYRFDYEEVRISILWKAHCFKNQAEADSYEDHSHDLSAATVVDIFSSALKAKGIQVKEPDDLYTDEEWKKLLIKEYGR